LGVGGDFGGGEACGGGAAEADCAGYDVEVLAEPGGGEFLEVVDHFFFVDGAGVGGVVFGVVGVGVGGGLGGEEGGEGGGGFDVEGW